MIEIRARSNLLAVAVLLLSACGRGSNPAKAPTPAEAYSNAVAGAEKKAVAGDYAGADRILADFALRAHGTSEAAEVSFWRALYMVDPQNRTASIPAGIRALDIYLATPGAKMYKAQAVVLKRTAQSVQALRLAQSQPAPPRVSGRDTVFVSREEEIATLKDQLSKANAELERIKKRLANPSR